MAKKPKQAWDTYGLRERKERRPVREVSSKQVSLACDNFFHKRGLVTESFNRFAVNSPSPEP